MKPPINAMPIVSTLQFGTVRRFSNFTSAAGKVMATARKGVFHQGVIRMDSSFAYLTQQGKTQKYDWSTPEARLRSTQWTFSDLDNLEQLGHGIASGDPRLTNLEPGGRMTASPGDGCHESIVRYPGLPLDIATLNRILDDGPDTFIRYFFRSISPDFAELPPEVWSYLNQTQWSTTVTTDPNNVGQYQVIAEEGLALVPFDQKVTLSFSVAFAGFIASANGLNHYMGSDRLDRPELKYVIGDATTPWWAALRELRATKAWPFMWDLIDAALPPGFIEGLCTRGERYSTFQVHGVMANVQRTNIKMVSEQQVPDQTS
jgi:hypothetical protein